MMKLYAIIYNLLFIYLGRRDQRERERQTDRPDKQIGTGEEAAGMRTREGEGKAARSWRRQGWKTGHSKLRGERKRETDRTNGMTMEMMRLEDWSQEVRKERTEES